MSDRQSTLHESEREADASLGEWLELPPDRPDRAPGPEDELEDEERPRGVGCEDCERRSTDRAVTVTTRAPYSVPLCSLCWQEREGVDR